MTPPHSDCKMVVSPNRENQMLSGLARPGCQHQEVSSQTVNANRITERSRLSTTYVINTTQEPNSNPPSTGVSSKTWETSRYQV
ncbi:hypothetical protein EYF80_035084 [Liparis tanakae]|uniref:Uncharacterized protein n=1 Tax=Liparis tanakae TaxID=230148 RepID=A0A4Z2GN56_9TELE|nr:hypothetical protein EYF80_035084 [Liparis tanakae]